MELGCSKIKFFFEIPFQNDMSTTHLTSELQNNLATLMWLQMYCTCHAKAQPRLMNSCNCHAKWPCKDLQSNIAPASKMRNPSTDWASEVWNVNPIKHETTATATRNASLWALFVGLGQPILRNSYFSELTLRACKTTKLWKSTAFRAISNFYRPKLPHLTHPCSLISLVHTSAMYRCVAATLSIAWSWIP